MIPGLGAVRPSDSEIAALDWTGMAPVSSPGLSDERIRLEPDDVAEAVEHLVADFEQAGVHRGTRVGVYLRGGIEFVVALYALHELGATLVPVDVLDWSAIAALPDARLDVLITHRCESDTIDEVLDVMADVMTGVTAIGAGYELVSIRTDRHGPVGFPDLVPLTVRTIAQLVEQTAAALQLGPHDRVAMWDGFCTPIGIATVLAARHCGAEMRLGDRGDAPTVLMLDQHRLLDHAAAGSVAATTSVVVPGGRLSTTAAAHWGLVEVGSVTTSAIYRCSRVA